MMTESTGRPLQQHGLIDHVGACSKAKIKNHFKKGGEREQERIKRPLLSFHSAGIERDG